MGREGGGRRSANNEELVLVSIQLVRRAERCAEGMFDASVSVCMPALSALRFIAFA
jgi:hypothetical protein